MLVAQVTVKGPASVDGSEFFPEGMDGPTVNHAGQKLIPGERTAEPARGGGRRNFSCLRGQGSFGAGLEVPFLVWTISLGVEVALGGLPWGDRRGEGQGFWDGCVLGSNALV